MNFKILGSGFGLEIDSSNKNPCVIGLTCIVTYPTSKRGKGNYLKELGNRKASGQNTNRAIDKVCAKIIIYGSAMYFSIFSKVTDRRELFHMS